MGSVLGHGGATNPAMSSVGFNQIQVTVQSITNGLAMVSDKYGRIYPPISVQNMVGSGAFPQVGEDWMVSRVNGNWTFQSKAISIPPTMDTVGDIVPALQALGFSGSSGITTTAMPTLYDIVPGLQTQGIAAPGPVPTPPPPPTYTYAPLFLLSQTAGGTIVNDASVPFNVATYDTRSGFVSSSHSYKIPVAGYWQVNWMVRWSYLVGTNFNTYCYNNGSSILIGGSINYTSYATNFLSSGGGGIVQCAVNDLLTILFAADHSSPGVYNNAQFSGFLIAEVLA
jgi:hypothetical protein